MGNSGKPYFRGQTVSRLDAKGRLRIPAKFREVLQQHYSDALMITLMGNCLVGYPRAVWEERIESKVENFSPVDPQQRAFMRYFVSSAEPCECDSHGRILIPQLLRERAGIDQEVVLAGLLTCFEIWDRGAWDDEFRRASDQHEQIMEKMAIVGL